MNRRLSAAPASASTLAALGALIASGALTALGAACNLPPSFGPEYEDSSANFIAGLPLVAPVDYNDQGATVALDALATWDWAWRGRTGNVFEYMTADSEGASGPSGAEAWRLETVNLSANRTATTTAGWTATGGASLSAASSLHGTALLASFSSQTQSIQLGAGFFADIDASQAHSYALVMHASGSTYMRYFDSESDAYLPENLQPLSWLDGQPNAVAFYAGDSGSTRRLVLTKADSSGLRLDDISALRVDVSADQWALCLRLGVRDASPSLVPGLYAFSVWVRRPAGYAFSSDAARADDPDYAARFITLSMTQYLGQSSQTTSRAWNISDPAVISDPDQWTRLELRLSPQAPFSFPESSAGMVVELRIACTGRQGVELEPGAVLIAQPSLNFFKDGY